MRDTMTTLPIRFDGPVTLVGGGALTPEMLAEARAIAPDLVAADSAADRLAEMRLTPRAVVGDMDSIAEPERWQGGTTHFIRLAEQESTDFEKCLYATEAPFYLAAGFTGRRVDHMMAAFNAVLRHAAKSVVLIGEEEVMALAPPGRRLRLGVQPGAIVSIVPLVPVAATHCRGLEYPVRGLDFAPDGRTGTSNRAAQPVVEMTFDRPGAMLMLERRYLATLVGALNREIGPG